MGEDIRAVRGVFAPGSPALAAFDYLLAHARAAAFKFVVRTSGEVQSVELQWKDRRRKSFSAQARPHHVKFYLRRPILNEHGAV